jgi:hypothetical protein
MKPAALTGLLLDFEFFFSHIRDRFPGDTPVSPVRFIDTLLPHDQPNLEFVLEFTTEDSGFAAFCVAFVGYYPTFRTETIGRLIAWLADNPGRHFLVVIFNFVPRSWTSFTASRSKVEEEFGRFQIDAPVYVVKYNEQDPQRVSDSDIDDLRERLESYVAFTLSSHIRSLIGGETRRSNGLEDTYSLCRLLYKLGYYSSAMQYFGAIHPRDGRPFWPAVPPFYDITREHPDDLSSGVCVLCTAMSSFFRCALVSKSFDSLYEFVTRCFATLLDNSGAPEQLYYSRHFIQMTAAMFADRLEDTMPDWGANFAWISLDQLSALLQVPAGWDDPFVANIPTGRRDHGFLEQSWIMEWIRAKRVRGDAFKMHKLYFISTFFNFLCRKNDVAAAQKTLSDFGIIFSSKSPLNSLFEAQIVRCLFEWNPTSQLAEAVIKSRLPDDIKLGALRLLTKTYPNISIRPHFRSPTMLTIVPLFSPARFTFTFMVPGFLMGQTATLVMKFLGEEHTLKSDAQTIRLVSSETCFASTLICNFAGTYEMIVFCITIEECQLRWRLSLEHPLVVDIYQNYPEISVRVPWLVSTASDRQAAVVTISNIDTECQKIGVSFGGGGLLGIRFEERSLEPSEELVLTKIKGAMDILLILDFEKDDQLTTNFHYVLKDGQEGDVMQTCDYPVGKPFNLTLFAQNSHFQQFRLLNEFPTSFTFEFLGKVHTVKPLANYYLIRPTSSDPLRLSLVEEGWEKFPVTFECRFDCGRKILPIEMNIRNWAVGESRIAVLGEAATVVTDAADDWIVAAIDVEQTRYLLIPKRRGRLKMPVIIVRSQVVHCEIEFVEILSMKVPRFILV